MRESKHAEKGALYTVLTAAATVISGFLFVPAVTNGIMYITQGKNAGNAIAGVVLIIVCAAVAAAVMLLWRKIGKSTFWRWMSASGAFILGLAAETVLLPMLGVFSVWIFLRRIPFIF